MKRIVQLVDSVEYVKSNCFQHQLQAALSKECELVVVTLQEVLTGAPVLADGFISCLKQRTLMKNAEAVGKWLHGAPITAYDQDPWQSYMDDSPYKGAYDVITRHMNVKSFALTTKWWVDFVANKGLPTTFVRMWVLPEYCGRWSPYVDRKHAAGFVGTVHPRRKQLLDTIDSAGIKTSVFGTSSLSYTSFLQKIGELKCFVHNEDMLYEVDGQVLNFNTGMWVKDVEAASQGCFSIRGRGEGSETYLEGIETVRLYDDIDQVPSIIRAIENMDVEERQASIDRSVEFIRRSNRWQETARTLINAS